MRYQDWDVLLFPAGSKIPIQEFKTQYHVTRDLESPFLHSSTFTGVPFASDGPALSQLPVLTSFIPSLFQNAPFRVSIHSWEKPKPSRMMESLVGPHDAILFEARVYIDGVLVADSVFDHRTIWPHVLDTCAQLDAVGNEKTLRFPPFHQEILYQSHWEAGELLGRIRIVIAEGFSRDIGIPQGHFFDRVRDVIAFSFQHAPLHILEFSGIAWPNTGMWKKASGVVVSRGPLQSTKSPHTEDLHAHSPRHPTGWGSRAMLPPIAPASDPTSTRSAVNCGLPIMPGHALTEDPFTDLRRTNVVFRRSKRSTLDDTPMPDYVSTSTERSRAYSDMTGLSYERKKERSGTTLLGNDASLEELIDRLSPEKSRDILLLHCTPSKNSDRGIQVPTNSPSSNAELPSQSSATVQGTNLEHEAFTRSKPSLRISPELVESELPRAVPLDASPVSSTRGKKKPAFDREDSVQRRTASYEVTSSSSTSFKVAVSSLDRPIVISSDINRSRSDSNGSKRKRSNPNSPRTDDGEISPCSPIKKTSREA